MPAVTLDRLSGEGHTTFLRRHPVVVYFGLTFAISWGGMLLAIGTAGSMRGTTPGSAPRFPYAMMSMLAGPSVMGLLMTALVNGRTGLRGFVSHLLAWRADAR